ncbi:MAG: hypothetical protein QM487_06395 [Candidatus Marithrix sp.]
MTRNLLAIFLIFTISCTGNTTESSLATPSTTRPTVEITCNESKQFLLQNTEKILQELGFTNSNLTKSISDFQYQHNLEVTDNLNTITYLTILEKFKLPKLQISEEIYAIEKIKCEKYGQWIQLYKGILKKITKDIVEVQLKQRYGIKHNPTKQGISNTDWFCVPKRKYCYSEINFQAWQGKYQPNKIITLPKTDIFLAKSGIIPIIEEILQIKCDQ